MWASDENKFADVRKPNDELNRARENRVTREADLDAKMERSVRIVMAAKEDSEGNCFYCGRKLDVEEGAPVAGVVPVTKLHPRPHLDCAGPSKISQTGRIQPGFMALAEPKALPDIPRVVRPFGERD